MDKLEASIAAYLPDFEMNGKQQLTQEKWVQAVMHQYRKVSEKRLMEYSFGITEIHRTTAISA